MARRLALPALCLALSLALGGCWVSETFLLDATQAARVLATGRQVLADKAEAVTVDVAPQSDGWYELREDGAEPSRVIFIPIPGWKDRYFFGSAHMESGKPIFQYGVAIRRGAEIRLDMPMCSEPAAKAIALRNDARVEENACTFNDRAGLTQALTEFARTSRPIDKLPALPALP